MSDTPTIDFSKGAPDVKRLSGWPEFHPPLPSEAGQIMAMDLFGDRLTVMCVNGPYQLVDGQWTKLNQRSALRSPTALLPQHWPRGHR